MIWTVTVGERRFEVDLRPHGDGFAVRVDGGEERIVDARDLGGAEWLLRVDDKKHTLGLHVDKDRFVTQIGGHAVRGQVVDARRAALEMTGQAGLGEVRTQMPGAVVRVPVLVGAEVHKGQVLVVVEAMKMENEFKAPVAGKVIAIHVKAGQAVEANAILVIVEGV